MRPAEERAQRVSMEVRYLVTRMDLNGGKLKRNVVTVHARYQNSTTSVRILC
jgi:hypothetical protein